jgi:heme exporter protein A
MDGPSALELSNVSKRFGARWALVRVSLTLERGAALLLTGHNGSGKTTLLRLLATAIRPSAGRMRVLGFEGTTGQEEIRARVAFLGHSHFVYEDLSAKENLTVLARLLGERDGAAAEALMRVGLQPADDRPVRAYSAGMRKRLALARLFLKRPELALLDEPFGALDPAGIAEIEGRVRELRASGTTLVLATHQVEQGRQLCTDRLHLDQGRATAA